MAVAPRISARSTTSAAWTLSGGTLAFHERFVATG